MQNQKRQKASLWLKALRIALVLLIASAVAMFLIKKRPRPVRQEIQNLPPLVEVIRAHKTTDHMLIRTYGTIRSGENLALTAELRGTVQEMASFEEGRYFSKGAFLMRIDPRSYRLSVERARTDIKRLDAELAMIAQEKANLESSLKIAQEDLSLAKAEYDRNLSLAERKVVSKNQLDLKRQRWLSSRQKAQEIENALALIKPKINLLKAQRQTALVKLKEAKLDMDKTEIRAPFDCRVAEKHVETGQYVNAGKVLATIYNVAIMEIEVRLPPKDMAWLHLDSQNPSGELPHKATITFNAGGNKYNWEGFVVRYKGQMEESTRTLPLIIQIEDSHPKQAQAPIPGMFVTVEITGRKIKDLFLLPQEAVHEDSMVYIVEGDKVRMRPVKVFRRRDNQVYVKEGLSDGDLIITRFPGIPSENMTVRVKP